MKASEAVKIKDKVMAVIESYAYLAKDWGVGEEDDFEDFEDAILDAIAEGD